MNIGRKVGCGFFWMGAVLMPLQERRRSPEVSKRYRVARHRYECAFAIGPTHRLHESGAVNATSGRTSFTARGAAWPAHSNVDGIFGKHSYSGLQYKSFVIRSMTVFLNVEAQPTAVRLKATLPTVQHFQSCPFELQVVLYHGHRSAAVRAICPHPFLHLSPAPSLRTTRRNLVLRPTMGAARNGAHWESRRML